MPAFSPAGAASRHVAAAASLMGAQAGAGRDIEAGGGTDRHDDASDIASRLRMPMHQWRLLAAAAAASAERSGSSEPSGVSEGILRGLAAYGGLSTAPSAFGPAGVAALPAPGLSRRDRIAAAERARMSAAGDDSTLAGAAGSAASAGGSGGGGSGSAGTGGASGRRDSFVAFRNPLSA